MIYKQQNIKWFFPEESSVSDKLVDSFTDSKFNIDKWTSFSREIIQNSLDVPDEVDGEKKTVRVEFSLQSFRLEDIPGGVEIKNILEKAQHKAENQQTKDAYLKGLEILCRDKILCLKVSDYNTIGVREGRDNEWGALVYDEGKSKKRRPGSAGSHGVGKKAPFIISSINTVFYSTNTKDGASLTQGKCSLVNWDDENGITRSPVGWYGIVDESNNDRRNKVQPINNFLLEDNFINDFFVRKKDVLGTDVIIIGVNFENEYEIKNKIINAVLENFFVAIDRGLLEICILGVEINRNNLEKIINDFYKNNRNKSLKKDTEITNIKYGNLTNYFDVYKCQDPKIIDLIIDNKNYGYIELFFGLKNDKGRKYYCVFREHGMKIKDISLSTDQDFSAVIIIRDSNDDKLKIEEKVNSRLSRIENAAHDDFIIDDTEVMCDEITKKLVKTINSEINNYIKEKTEIVVTDETPLDGLDEMLAIQGKITTKIRRLNPKIIKKKNKIKKRGKGKKALTYDDGVSGIGDIPGKKRKKGKGENKPAKEGDDFSATLFSNFLIQPYFLHSKDEYILTIISNENIENSEIKIIPISVDGTLVPIDDIILSAYDEFNNYIISNNIIKNVKFKASKKKVIKIKLKNDLNYSLGCEVGVKKRYE